MLFVSKINMGLQNMSNTQKYTSNSYLVVLARLKSILLDYGTLITGYSRLRARPCNQQTIRPCTALFNQKDIPKTITSSLASA